MHILVVDDEASIREAYRHVFQTSGSEQPLSRAKSLANELFGGDGDSPDGAVGAHEGFEVVYASQGEEAISLVEGALVAGIPFKVVFLDVRMPPGIDGKETARRIRMADPDINIVMVTGYSDHSVIDIATVAGPADKLFYICKPFAAEEVRHMAHALVKRWDHDTRQIALLQEKVAELAASEARAHHMANHDFLTGAPNRMAFQREAVIRLQTQRAGMFLALFDLDRFKHVNDTFGHGAGDNLLIKVYQALCHTAPEHTLIARLGGDEFGVIFEAASMAEAMAVCQSMVDACTRTFTVFGNSVHIGASCGIVDCDDYPEHEAHDIMRFADLALFAAKRADGVQLQAFDQALDLSQQFRHRIEMGLSQAIANDELELHYQPIVERDTLEVIGYESLLRWNSHEHGAVSPVVFIPIAEESQIIHLLGEWVVARAFTDAHNWPGKLVSINFSPRQFKRADFVDWLAGQARKFDIEPGRVQIEITETALFESVEEATRLVGEARAHGFLVALDDFGTGYSSMFNLKSFAVDCIKIDRSFVDGLGADKHSAAIVNAIAHLAQGLGLSIVAEGVENQAQCQVLRLVGCSHMQGFLFGKAVPLATLQAQAGAPLQPPAGDGAAVGNG